MSPKAAVQHVENKHFIWFASVTGELYSKTLNKMTCIAIHTFYSSGWYVKVYIPSLAVNTREISSCEWHHCLQGRKGLGGMSGTTCIWSIHLQGLGHLFLGEWGRGEGSIKVSDFFAKELFP